MSEVSSLLRKGWENISKSKILWGFSFLVLIEPVVRLVIPSQRSRDLSTLLFDFAVSITSLYLLFISEAGVSYVSYCIAIGKPVNVKTAYQVAKKVFWRVVGLTIILFLIVSPFVCAVFLLSFKQPLQIADLSHNFFLALTPLSVFYAVLYFAITEIVANNSTIGKSLKVARTIFTDHIVSLAIMGLLLAVISHMVNVSICATIMLAQNGFAFASLSKLDFISPQVPLVGNNFYGLVIAVFSAAWSTYNVSVFTVAYLKYNGVNKK